MPVGVYRKKNKKGNWMYFRNGKLISKKSFDMSKSRSTSPKRKRKTGGLMERGYRMRRKAKKRS